MGPHCARLLGHDGKAHRGIDRGVPPGGQPQSEFGGRPRLPQPHLRLCRPEPRGYPARRRCDQADPWISEMAFFLGGIAVAHYTAGRLADAVRYARKPCTCARASKGRNGCAARVWPRPAGSMRRERFSQPYVASSRSCPSTGYEPAFPTKRGSWWSASWRGCARRASMGVDEGCLGPRPALFRAPSIARRPRQPGRLRPGVSRDGKTCLAAGSGLPAPLTLRLDLSRPAPQMSAPAVTVRVYSSSPSR